MVVRSMMGIRSCSLLFNIANMACMLQDNFLLHCPHHAWSQSGCRNVSGYDTWLLGCNCLCSSDSQRGHNKDSQKRMTVWHRLGLVDKMGMKMFLHVKSCHGTASLQDFLSFLEDDQTNTSCNMLCFFKSDRKSHRPPWHLGLDLRCPVNLTCTCPGPDCKPFSPCP